MYFVSKQLASGLQNTSFRRQVLGTLLVQRWCGSSGNVRLSNLLISSCIYCVERTDHGQLSRYIWQLYRFAISCNLFHATISYLSSPVFLSPNSLTTAALGCSTRLLTESEYVSVLVLHFSKAFDTDCPPFYLV